MRKLILILTSVLFLLVSAASAAVEAQTAPASSVASPEFVVAVAVDSAFIRAAPSLEAEAIASVFENDNLVAFGRNIDGLWVQVRRPARRDKVGWIAREVLFAGFEV
ncbi:MAG TPA: SH3 domain-containing protein, partial [Phototrophicaceae bacterium]|nr:SH3 domain-containing protein [Phototrophicaceae bacterium]